MSGHEITRNRRTESARLHPELYVNAELSNADHGFFCDDRAAYQPNNTRQSWASTVEFLRS